MNRELQIFRLIGRGIGTRAVAGEFSLSMTTAETHRQRIREKLRVGDGAELNRRVVLSHGSR